MTIVLLTILAVIFAMFGLGAFHEASVQKKELLSLQKEMEKKESNERESIANTVQAMQETNSGNHAADLQHMADKLHQYNQRK